MIPESARKYIYYEEYDFILLQGECLDVMSSMEDNSVDSIVTDPPYGLSFMGKKWDYKVPSVDIWTEALRVLKPGGHLLSFAGSRTYHRMTVNIEDAGFEIRDQIMWLYGSGFPKSHDISKAIDKRGGAQIAWFGPWFRKWREENGITQKEVATLFPSKTGGLTGCVANWELGFNMPTPEQFNLIRDIFKLPFNNIEEAEREVIGERTTGIGTGNGNTPIMGDTDNRSVTAPATPEAKEWDGWGTALKPAHEPICVARKPLTGTVAENVLEHGTGGINIDACRIGTEEILSFGSRKLGDGIKYGECKPSSEGLQIYQGRFPANLILDEEAGVMLDKQSGVLTSGVMKSETMRAAQNEPGSVCYGTYGGYATGSDTFGDVGGASRFFYCAKASKEDRDEGLEGMEEKQRGQSYRLNSGGDLKQQTPHKHLPQLNHHPTVKPTSLMQYLIRLVTPPGGTVLDPFMGSGSTGKAAIRERFKFIGIERDKEYLPIARARIKAPAQTVLI